MNKDAKTLAELAQKIKNERAEVDSKTQLNMVLEEAEKSANNGEFYIYLGYDINEITKDRLIEMGFEVNLDSDHHYSSWKISWEHKLD